LPGSGPLSSAAGESVCGSPFSNVQILLHIKSAVNDRVNFCVRAETAAASRDSTFLPGRPRFSTRSASTLPKAPDLPANSKWLPHYLRRARSMRIAPSAYFCEGLTFIRVDSRNSRPTRADRDCRELTQIGRGARDPCRRAQRTTLQSSILRQASRGRFAPRDFSVVVSLFLRRRKTRKIRETVQK
jgi:hypothetical protein